MNVDSEMTIIYKNILFIENISTHLQMYFLKEVRVNEHL